MFALMSMDILRLS